MNTNVLPFPKMHDQENGSKLVSNQQDLDGRSSDLSINTYNTSSVQNERMDQVKADIEQLSTKELNEKYKLTHSSWRNMKQRRKKGAVIAKEFQSFKSFLQHMGPRPNRKYTLDRLDNNNPTYGPGLCAWKDKTDQANNRSTTIHLTHKGECLPLTTWAHRTKQKADTLRSRRSNGWSDEEIITGKRIRKLTPLELLADPIPWRGSMDYKVRLEEWYRKVRKKAGFSNRYEAYISHCNGKWRHYHHLLEEHIYQKGEDEDRDLCDRWYEAKVEWLRRARILEQEHKEWLEKLSKAERKKLKAFLEERGCGD